MNYLNSNSQSPGKEKQLGLEVLSSYIGNFRSTLKRVTLGFEIPSKAQDWSYHDRPFFSHLNLRKKNPTGLLNSDFHNSHWQNFMLVDPYLEGIPPNGCQFIFEQKEDRIGPRYWPNFYRGSTYIQAPHHVSFNFLGQYDDGIDPGVWQEFIPADTIDPVIPLHGSLRYKQNNDKVACAHDAIAIHGALTSAVDNSVNAQRLQFPSMAYWATYDKAELHEKLIKTSNLLSTHDNALSKHLSKVIHSHLHAYMDSVNAIHLYEAASFVYNYVQNATDGVKKISKRLKRTLCKCSVKLNRDLRKSFRSIVHFLFKNMDADTDHNEYLFDQDKKQNSFIKLKCQHYDKRRYNSLFKYTY